MKEVDREEIKSFEQLRARIRRFVELHEGPLPSEAVDMVREFMPEDDFSEKETPGGD